MKKTKYQLVYENLAAILVSLGAMIGIINGTVNLGKVIPIQLKYLFILLVIICWLLLIYLVKARKIKWVKEGYIIIRPKKLGMKINLNFFSILMLLGIYIGVDFLKERDKNTGNQQLIQAPVFKKGHKNFSLLILRWQKECDYQGKLYDIGLVLKKRFENIVEKDSINLQVHYLADSIMPENFNKDMACALMKYHHADMILHGSYSFSECEGGHGDKVCYMYQADTKKTAIEYQANSNEYKMHNIHGLQDIREGAGQENIDYIIYWVAGMLEFRNDRYTRAISMFEKIKDYKDNPAVQFQISNCYYEMKDYSNTRAALEQVLKKDPHHQEATIHRSLLLMREGKIKLAKKHLEKIQVNQTTDFSVLRDLSLIYKRFNDTPQYRMYLTKLLSRVPETDSTYKSLGHLYRDIGNYRKAKELFTKAFYVCSRHADDWNELGKVNMLLKDTTAAKPYFNKALALNPQSFTALYNWGIILQKEKQFKEAQVYLEKAVQLDPWDENVYYALGRNYEVLHDKTKALDCFEKALVINPATALALLGASSIHMEFKHFDKANTYLDKLLRHYKYSPQLLHDVGRFCSKKGNYRQAEIYYKRLLKMAPGNFALLYNIAGMAANQNQPLKALNYLKKALSANPTVIRKIVKRDKSFDGLRDNKKFISIIQ